MRYLLSNLLLGLGREDTAPALLLKEVFGGAAEDFRRPVLERRSLDARHKGSIRFLMAISDLLRSNGIMVIVVVSVLIAAFHRYRKTPAGAFQWDRFCLNFPITGVLARKIAVGRFASTFAH